MARVLAFKGIRPASLNIEKKELVADSNIRHNLNEDLKNKNYLKDEIPSFYAYQHTYQDNFGIHTITGIIGLVSVSPNLENKVRPHENTIDKRVKGLKEYFINCKIQKDTALCFYKDEEGSEQIYINDALVSPINIFKTGTSTFSIGRIYESHKIDFLHSFFKKKTLYLADGHHRYQALIQIERENNSEAFLLSLLVNTAFSNLKVLPYHRLYKGSFDENKLISQIKEDFALTPCSETEISVLPKNINHFNLVINKKNYKASLRAGKSGLIPWKFPDFIKNLDHTIVHYYFFEKYLGIKGREQRNSENIKYCSIFMDCLREVEEDKANLVILTREITYEDIIQVADSGYLYPQKTSYFYPKAISGLLFAEVI